MLQKFGWLALFLPVGLMLLAGECFGPAPGTAWAAAKRKGTHRTAKRPEFDQQTLDAFFADAREKLGPGEPGLRGRGGGNPGRRRGRSARRVGGRIRLVEIDLAQHAGRRHQGRSQSAGGADQDAQHAFNGGGNREARKLFTELAMFFSVIADYDKDVRWKREAADLRSLFGRAAANCKTGGANSFRVAQTRTTDLTELVRGSKINVPKDETDFKWAEVVNRSPLMTRMGKEGYSVKLKNWTSGKNEFSKNRAELLQEAEIMAVIGHVIQDESYEYADDESYLEFAKILESQGQEIAEAAKTDNFERAQTAAGLINKACSGCHEGYRS